MPVILDTQKAVREVRDLPFCYLCGRPFGPDEKTNPDHIPPTGLFAIEDRDFPLILPTHRSCNASQSPYDQVVAQLVGMIHGREDAPQHLKLKLLVGHRQDGSLAVAAADLQLRNIIRRWVRAFHAALYREPLPDTREFSTCPPLPEADPASRAYLAVPSVFAEFVNELKRNRATSTLDKIVCRNGMCRYECVWSQADHGAWMCIYGLNVYDWINLGDTSVEARGCVGSYIRPEGGTPRGATCTTRLVFTVANRERLNPFGE